jgi:transcription elongation factor GreA
MKTTIIDNKILLSKKGYKELKKTIASLEQQLKKVRQELHDADKSQSREEQLERVEKLHQLHSLESELSDRKATLKQSSVLPAKQNSIRVALGSVVELIDKRGKSFRYTLVESLEANPSDGRISILSPLGQTLVGKTALDTIEWIASGGKQTMKLMRVM